MPSWLNSLQCYSATLSVLSVQLALSLWFFITAKKLQNDHRERKHAKKLPLNLHWNCQSVSNLLSLFEDEWLSDIFCAAWQSNFCSGQWLIITNKGIGDCQSLELLKLESWTAMIVVFVSLLCQLSLNNYVKRICEFVSFCVSLHRALCCSCLFFFFSDLVSYEWLK